MLDTIFVEPRENRAEAAADFALLLNAYAEAVLRFKDDPRLLYGSAVSMRKTAEAVGAYVMYYLCGASAIRDGDNVMQAKDRTEESGKRFKHPDIWRDYISFRDELVRNERGKEGVNYEIHYQPFEDAAQEREALEKGYRLFFRQLRKYNELLTWFWEVAPEVKSAASKEETPALREFAPLNIIGFQEAAEERLKATLQSIEDVYRESESTGKDAWLEWQCGLLNRYEGLAAAQLAEADLMTAVTRIITERSVWRYLWKSGATKSRNAPNHTTDDTLDDLLKKMATAGGSDEVLYGYAKLVQTKTNPRLHWKDGEWCASIPDQMRGRSRDSYRKERELLYSECAEIVRSCIPEQRDGAAREWVRKNRGSREEREEELRKVREEAAAEERLKLEGVLQSRNQRMKAQEEQSRRAQEEAKAWKEAAKRIAAEKAALAASNDKLARELKEAKEAAKRREDRKAEENVRQIETAIRKNTDRIEEIDELFPWAKLPEDGDSETTDVFRLFNGGKSRETLDDDDDDDLFGRAGRTVRSGTAGKTAAKRNSRPVYDDDEDDEDDEDEEDKWLYRNGYCRSSCLTVSNWFSIILNIVSFPLMLATLFLIKGNPWLRNLDHLHIASVALGLLLWTPLGISALSQVYQIVSRSRFKKRYAKWTVYETLQALTLLLCTAFLICGGSKSGLSWERAILITEYIELFIVPLLAVCRITEIR